MNQPPARVATTNAPNGVSRAYVSAFPFSNTTNSLLSSQRLAVASSQRLAIALIEGQLRDYQLRHLNRPHIITPPNPAGRSGGPDSDDDEREERFQVHHRRYLATRRHGLGPLDPDPDELQSDASEEDPNIHIIINDGRRLHHVPVARYRFEAPRIPHGEDSDADDDALETMLRVDELLVRQHARHAAREDQDRRRALRRAAREERAGGAQAYQPQLAGFMYPLQVEDFVMEQAQ